MQQELRTLVCIDQDQAAFAVAEPQLAAVRRDGLDVRLHQGNFRSVQNRCSNATR
jgi:16S rRNA C1402 N4-methylase RsmH